MDTRTLESERAQKRPRTDGSSGGSSRDEIFSIASGSDCRGIVKMPSLKAMDETTLESERAQKRPRTDRSSESGRTKPIWLVTQSPDFKEIVELPSFVDHSDLIKVFMEECPKKLFIAAPSKFCKTSNLHMIRCCLGIEVHPKSAGEKCGEPLRDISLPAKNISDLRQLPNYQLFERGNCSILNEEDFVKEHFGRHPVIYLELGVSVILHSYEAAVAHCKRAVHKAFRRHEYLKFSTKLDTTDVDSNIAKQSFCKKWCSEVDFENQSECHVLMALDTLSEYLYLHWDRKVIILIDEYDAIITSALLSKENKELGKITSFTEEFIAGVAKNSNDQIEKLLLTGISALSGMGFSKRLSEIIVHKFGEHEYIVPFYGITKNAVEGLVTSLKNAKKIPKFDNLGVEHIVQEIKRNFNGYCTQNGTCIYSLWCTLYYLQAGTVNAIPSTTPTIVEFLGTIIRDSNTALSIVELAGYGTVKVTVEQIGIRHLEEIQESFTPGSSTAPDPDVIFSLMLELGYLTSVENKWAGPEDSVELRVSNEYMRTQLLKTLKGGVVEIIGVNHKMMAECAAHIERICCAVNEPEKFKDLLKQFRGRLANLFKGLHRIGSALVESCFTSVLFASLAMKPFDRLSVDSTLKSNTGEAVTRGRPDVWILHKKTQSAVVWELKFNKTASGKENKQGLRNKTSLFALREMLGGERKSSYICSYQKLNVDKFIVFGLSVDGDLEPSICCVVKTEDTDNKVCVDEHGKPSVPCVLKEETVTQACKHVMCVSQNEPTSFRDDYRNYFDVLKNETA